MYKVMMEYAHHSHGEFDVLSENASKDADSYFDKIDWPSEVKKSNEIQKVSPTLSLKDESGGKLIWVSAYGNESDPDFVSECQCPGEVSSMFGLMKRQGTVSLNTDTFSKEEAKKALELFINNAYEELRNLYKNT